MNQATKKRQETGNVFYSPTQGIIDEVMDDGLSCIRRHTLEQVKIEYGNDVSILTWQDATEAYRLKFTTNPKEISKEQWEAALGILPPDDFQGDSEGNASFKSMERRYADITAIYCWLGDGQCFMFADSYKLPQKEIVKRCLDYIQEQSQEAVDGQQDETVMRP